MQEGREHRSWAIVVPHPPPRFAQCGPILLHRGAAKHLTRPLSPATVHGRLRAVVRVLQHPAHRQVRETNTEPPQDTVAKCLRPCLVLSPACSPSFQSGGVVTQGLGRHRRCPKGALVGLCPVGSLRRAANCSPAGRKVAGALHLAGILDDAMIPQLTRAHFERAFGPKAMRSPGSSLCYRGHGARLLFALYSLVLSSP